ncbi:MAG TPA: fibronectin type III domain-containing protein [Terriglobales bacterium]|nr:fibronectin type III domain-containing protein [Terriglobales bacterium]
MKRLTSCPIKIIIISLLCILTTALQAQVNVTTYHNDTSRTGQNTQETILTPANVNSSQFGKLFTVSVDGYVYAQPLYLSNVTIAGGTHNVLYVATEHDSLYAIDAGSGTIYWQISLIPSGGSTVNSSTDLGCGDLVPEVGITGTPVIDPTTGTIYVVAKSKVNGNLVQYLHAIDVGTAVEKFSGPVFIQATVPGTASDGNGTTVSFSPHFENQRAALLLENGHVVIGWSAHCDISPWHGWIMSYSASTLAQEAAFNASADGSANGVWMSGEGLAADANGNIFFATGNGTWNGTTDYGDSIVKLGPPSGGSFTVLDYFTPYNQSSLSGGDTDVGSGGMVLLPNLSSGQQLLVQMGKEGKMYLIDRNNMGKYCVNDNPPCNGSDPNIVQEIPGATAGVWGTPAYWNGSVYWGGASENLKAFSFNANSSGLISTSPTSESAQSFSFPGPSPTISANGNTDGILWGLDNSAFGSTCSGGSNCQVLYAYDATNLANLLYTSSQAANNRDVPGSAIKFATPIVANGKVYFGSQLAVSAYGAISTIPTVATPTFSPAPGPYNPGQVVTLSDTTTGAVIHCTTDGSTPTAGSPVCTTLTLETTTTIQAIAVASGYNNSAVASGTYIINTGNPIVNYSSGFNSTGLALNGFAKLNGTRLRLTDGGGGEASSAFYTTPVNVQSFTTNFSFQMTDAQADGMTFVIQNGAATSLGQGGGGLGYENIGNSVAVKFDIYNNAGEGTDSTGMYENGATPTVPAVDMTSSGVVLLSGDVMNVQLSYNGTTLSLSITDATTNAKFTTSWTVNIPTTVGSTTALVGFTGGTGGTTSIQDVLSWTYATGSNTNPPPAPTNLVATPGNAQVGLNWSASSGATSYNVQRSTTSGGPYTTIGSPTTTSYTDTGITNGTTYYYVVSAVNTAGQSGNSSQVTATPLAIPPAPTNLVATAGNAQVGLNWSASSGATSYNVQRSTTSGGPYTTIGSPTTTSYTDTAVTNETTYYYVVAAVNTAGQSANSSQVSATPLAIPPVPTNLAATAGNAQVGLSWSASSGATSYNVKRSTTSGGPYTTIASPTTMSYTDTGVTNGTSYYYVVAAVNAAGQSANSSQVSATPTSFLINYGSGFSTSSGLQLNGSTMLSGNRLRLTDGGGGEASSAFYTTPVNVQSFTTNFSFQMTDANADGMTFVIQNGAATSLGEAGEYLGYGEIGNSVAVKFDIFNNAGEGTDSTGMYVNGATPTVPAVDMTSSGVVLLSGDVMNVQLSYNGTTLTLTITDATTSAKFTTSWTVNIPTTVGSTTALVGFTGGTGGTTSIQDVLSWTYNTGSNTNPPPAPMNLVATPGNAQVGLSWNASSGATSYNVQRSTTSGGPYTTIGSPTTTSYTDTGVTNGTTYYYVVAAVNAAGQSANSSQVSATPLGVPPAPTNLVATPGNAQVGLSWSASSGATSYNVQRSTTSGGPYTTIGSPTTTSYTDTAVTNGTTYYYVVAAVNTAGQSANSSQVVATPTAGAIVYEATKIPVTGSPDARTFTWTGFPDGAGVIADGTAVGAYLNFTVNVSASGTYDIKVGSKQIITRGIFQLSVNGTNVGPTEDEYNANANGVFQEFDLGNMTFPTPGNYSFKFTVIGHDSSSSGYTVCFDYIKLTPQ